jgi:hypothetical protein
VFGGINETRRDAQQGKDAQYCPRKLQLPGLDVAVVNTER